MEHGNEPWVSTHCDHTKKDFQMSFTGHMYLSGGNLHENFEECYICVKCGRVYTEREFDQVPDEPTH